MNGIKKGIWPTMITPYDREGRVDLNAAKRIVDWYAEKGCDGIFAVCQSSEMFDLTLTERVQLAQTVVSAAKGRLEVIGWRSLPPGIFRTIPPHRRKSCALLRTRAFPPW